ncbi:high affinity cationic amino acid transporter 1 isoform X1 [Rhynchophorus ferrugineus]|uniref:high affinity cationic amino acid transporter 1 isoform X1 n=1 Tax=Rhynchophorus ferrugineus TaxID=354439 RepID=UPI003FCD6C80
MSRIWKILTRKKAIEPATTQEVTLNRILNTFDLTALGVGSTLGVGVYVLGGQVAKSVAGPSVVLSFLIAAVASLFAGLCYAEFGARAPRAGSAYIYSYICVGEFVAFVIGWNLILEYIIGSASVARSLSLYLDSLINNTMQDTFRHVAPLSGGFMSEYFDFFSFSISVLLAVALVFGVKESSMGNNIVTVLNILVLIFVVIGGSIKSHASNWYISPNNTNTTNDVGNGGFFPFGVEGMIKGAATCFYGFIGFDCIATTGEEVKNPRKAIPIAIIVSLFIVFCAYFGVSTVLTLMVPYYQLDHDAPIPRAFEAIGWYWAKWIVAIGALFGLCASLFGAMFPLPRIIYAMGSDGLVFKILAKVHPKYQTPYLGTIFAGILTGLMSALFNLNQLVNMMSIGTLLAYTIVAASVLILRYKEEVKKVYIPVKVSSDTDSTSSDSSDGEKYNDDTIRQNFDGPTTNDETDLINNESVSCWKSLLYIFNCRSREPNHITENIVVLEVFFYCILCVCLGFCAMYLKTPIINHEIWAITIVSIVTSITILLIISLSTQPTSKKELAFKVPFIPLIPAISIMVNIYLMLMLDYLTWIRFAVWMAIGIPMYVCVCSHKVHHKHVNGTNYSANIAHEHTKMLNGFSNLTFQPEETKNDTKKIKIAPSPPIMELNENIDIQDAVIAQLDQVLEKAVLNDWTEDSLNDDISRINDRKLSAGSVSNVSVVMSSSLENVIVDVHCVDINVNSPSNYDSDITLEAKEDMSNENNIIADQEVEETPVTQNVIVLSPMEYAHEIQKPKNSINDQNQIGIINDDRDELLIEKSLSKKFDEKINNEHRADVVKEIIRQSSIVRIDDNVNIHEINNSNSDIDEESAAVTSKNNNMPSENSATSESGKPTVHDLRSVTLRKVQKAIKEADPVLNENASDNNLKAGTEEFKNFLKKLDSKLKTRSVPPNYPFKSYIPLSKPKDVKPNENVIEEKIDTIEARNKLKVFLENENYRKSAGDVQKGDTTPNVLYETKNPLTIQEMAFKEHKIKMQNVFSSIKFKDNKKHDELSRRLSKSLGSSLLKEDHKIKMQDIFKSIESLKQ